MPRNVKESDDEVEAKSGRRTRASLNPSVLDSPLRRSTRIKQPTRQESLSPESVSDASSIGTTRNTKRRTTTGDAGVTEPVRSLRTRHNSVASDISELTETESLPDGPAKRVTRRSLAGISATEASTKSNSRARRTTRAGSESKSTSPVGRTYRRTRASSLESDVKEDKKIREVGTPIRSRRRASVLPSEPVVAEESEDSSRGNRRSVDKTVYEIDENESVFVDLASHNTSKSSRRNSKVDANESVEKMEVDESPVKESEGNTIERSTQENTEADDDISLVPKKLEDSFKVADSWKAKQFANGSPQRISSPPSKGSSCLLSLSTKEEEKSPGNKENEVLNDSVTLSSIEVRPLNRKSLNSSYVKAHEKGHIPIDDGLSSNDYETPMKSKEDVNTELSENSKEKLIRKERYSVDDCVVVIEPMEIDRIDKVVTPKASNTSETLKIWKTCEVVELNSEENGNEEIDCKLSDKQVEDTENAINENIADKEPDFKISNVVSTVPDENKKKEQEIINDFEPTATLNPEIDDTNEIIEVESLSQGVIDENASQEPSNLNNEPCILISENKGPCYGVNDVKTSMEPSISNTESRTSISEDNTPSNSVNCEKASTEPSSSNVQSIALCSSINNEKPINSDEIEDNLVFAKSKKSSIVTESSTSGVNGEENSNVIEEKKMRKSASRSSKGDENTSDEIKDKSLEKEIEDERKALQSGEESEYDGYPAFKDIPADEWTGGDNEESRKNKDIETNSVHSVSTERNESECDFELIDKEIAQSEEMEKEDQVRSDYDSDDTVKIGNATRKLKERKDQEKKEEEPVTDQETPMNLSSDSEEEVKMKINKENSKKRASLNTSRKINETNTPLANKNISLIGDTSIKGSPINLNVSQRKSLLSVDDQSNDSSNSSVKLNKSLKKYSLNANSRPGEDADNDNEQEVDNGESWTPKMVNRKSLDASGKKLKDRTLDSSKTIISAKNTPSNAEKRANKTSAKLNDSLNKSTLSSQSDGTEDSLDNATQSELTQKVNEVENIEKYALEVALKKQLRGILSTGNVSNVSLSRNNSPASPKIDKEQFNRSAKIGSARKSLNNKNSSKVTEIGSDSDIEIGESQEDLTSPEVQLNKSGKSASAKKLNINKDNSKTPLAGSDSKMEFEGYQESPVETQEEVLEKSVKLGSAKKSAKKDATILVISSDSAADDEDSQENSNKSSNSGRAKKPILDRNYSTIAQLNSDSEVDKDVESDSMDEMPSFLFNNVETSGDDDSSGSIDSDIARELNLHGKSVLKYSDDDVPADDCMATESESSDEDDNGSDLNDFVVDDNEEDEFEDVVMDLCLDDDEKNESSSSEEEKPRKRIIPRPAGTSDSDESDEAEPTNISPILDKSKTAKTPIKTTKLNETLEILEPEVKSLDLNRSAKNVAGKKDKNLLIQSSTPKTLARQSLLLEKSNLSKPTTPLNKSLKSADSSAKLEVSSSKRLSKSVCETIDTSTKLGSSFKIAKTPKKSLSMQQHLQTSLPTDLSDSVKKTNLSKAKSTKITMLNQTVNPSSSESPETRFLMKEKLNDSMPALKLQQRGSALRRSVLDNLREKVHATDEVPAEIDEILEKSVEKRVSFGKEEAASEPDISIKKKKKKKKKRQNLNASENPEEEIATSFIESVTEVVEGIDSSGTSSKKSKKLKKKKKVVETPEREETKVEEIPKKKKKKKQEKSIKEVELDRSDKKDKKKKNHKSVDHTEPEVVTLRQKSRRIAARNENASDSDEAPEAIDFTEARDAALRDLRKLTESIKASNEAKKKKHQEHLSSRQERKAKTRAEAAVKEGVKRLPEDFLENLSDVAERPKKRRKVIKEDKIVPSRTMFSPHHPKPENLEINDGYIPLSCSGGTTQFSVVNLKKATKHSKKTIAALNFRERMLARNPRQPISAYLMYQQKQKASGKG